MLLPLSGGSTSNSYAISLEDTDYLSNYYKISDEELQDRISKLGIVNGNSIVNVDEVMTLVLYVTYTPEELQISCKELSNSNDKTLIKK